MTSTGNTKNTAALNISADWGTGVQETFAEQQEMLQEAEELKAGVEEDYEEYFEDEYVDEESMTSQSFVERYRVPAIVGVIGGVLTFVATLIFIPESTMKDRVLFSAIFAFVALMLTIVLRQIVEQLWSQFGHEKIVLGGVLVGVVFGALDHLDVYAFTLPMIDIADRESTLRMLAYMAFGYVGGSLLQNALGQDDVQDHGSDPA